MCSTRLLWILNLTIAWQVAEIHLNMFGFVMRAISDFDLLQAKTFENVFSIFRGWAVLQTRTLADNYVDNSFWGKLQTSDFKLQASISSYIC